MKYFLLLFTCLIAVFTIAYAVHAQSPPKYSLALTWRAHNYYPADFPGKAQVTPRTPVSVSVQVTQDSKIVDLGEMDVVWRLDGKGFSRGVGLSHATFTARATPGTDHDVRVSVERGGEVLGQSSVRVPVVRPHLVFEHGFPDRVVQAGTQVLLRLVPYFFTITSLQDLRFFWETGAGGAPQIGEGDNVLALNVGGLATGVSEQTFLVTGTAQNISYELESARERILFTVVP